MKTAGPASTLAAIRQRPTPVARWGWRLGGLGLLTGLIGLLVGSTGPDLQLLNGLLHGQVDALTLHIVTDIRLPRTLGAWLAGALLGLAGALAQGLFRNPLADPFLLGSASGASLGVAVATALALAAPSSTIAWALGPDGPGLTGAAFLGAQSAVLLTMLLARGVQQTLRLLLAGVVVGVVLGALTSLVTLLQPRTLQAMQGFMLGSTTLLSGSACAQMAALLLLCVTVALCGSRALDALALGDATARSLGLPLAALRALLLVAMSLATAASVAHTGLIAFVGLAAPHLVRTLHPGPHAVLLRLSCLMGGLLLLAADVLARGLLQPQELPVGIFTALSGGLYLLWRMGRQTQGGA
jgi:iron complex transport system permease protein